jgi:hypothetical protein
VEVLLDFINAEGGGGCAFTNYLRISGMGTFAVIFGTFSLLGGETLTTLFAIGFGFTGCSLGFGLGTNTALFLGDWREDLMINGLLSQRRSL